jgi:hypothetical protein
MLFDSKIRLQKILSLLFILQFKAYVQGGGGGQKSTNKVYALFEWPLYGGLVLGLSLLVLLQLPHKLKL